MCMSTALSHHQLASYPSQYIAGTMVRGCDGKHMGPASNTSLGYDLLDTGGQGLKAPYPEPQASWFG